MNHLSVCNTYSHEYMSHVPTLVALYWYLYGTTVSYHQHFDFEVAAIQILYHYVVHLADVSPVMSFIKLT